MSRWIAICAPCATLLFAIGCATTDTSTTTAGVKPYRKTTCLVTGEKLDSKDMTITEVYGGQEVKFCCEPCQIAFHRNPETYMARLQ